MNLFRNDRVVQLENELHQLGDRVDQQAGFLEAKELELRKLRSDAFADAQTIERLEQENDRLRVQVEDLEHELQLACRHLNNCPTALAVADHDLDKRRENAL